jgi:mono/diheme cytochrome c family protein
MSKRPFIAFGLLVVVLAVVLPWLIFHSKGDAQTGDQEVAASLKEGQSLFQTNCGTCHTLYAAGTDGNYGPNLDELLSPDGVPTGPKAEEEIASVQKRVENAVKNGVDSTTTPGRMPGGVLNEEQTKEVAEFVANTAGSG